MAEKLSPITTKGDLIIGDNSGNTMRLAIGADGKVLTADAASTGGIKWETVVGGGGYTVHEIDNTDSPYTISETSGEVVILVDTSAGAVTVNLPTAVGNTAKYHIKLVADGNTLTIEPAGTETIDGSTNATVVVENVTITVINNNANWFIV